MCDWILMVCCDERRWLSWDCAEGVTPHRKEEISPGTIVKNILGHQWRIFYKILIYFDCVLKDFHHFIKPTLNLIQLHLRFILSLLVKIPINRMDFILCPGTPLLSPTLHPKNTFLILDNLSRMFLFFPRCIIPHQRYLKPDSFTRIWSSAELCRSILVHIKRIAGLCILKHR